MVVYLFRVQRFENYSATCLVDFKHEVGDSRIVALEPFIFELPNDPSDEGLTECGVSTVDNL